MSRFLCLDSTLFPLPSAESHTQRGEFRDYQGRDEQYRLRGHHIAGADQVDTHDTDGHAVGSLDLSYERERVEHEQCSLSRKEHGSANYRKQQRKVARRHADLKRKRRDFLHKLSNYYATEYDVVCVERLSVKGLVELPGNSRNPASAAWGTFLRMLEYKCDREGTHFVPVNPAGTTKECANCSVSTDKPLWVREHSCPACGFEADRDENAAWNIL